MGDQIIIPSRPVKIETKLPVEIFGIKKEFYLSPSEWKKNWQKYGILIPIKGKGVLQREKLDWKQVKELQGRDYLKPDSEGKLKIAKSMGCFSMDFILLKALLNEFKKEIELKKRKLDTDEHLWMPLLLQEMNMLKWVAVLFIGKGLINLKEFQKILDLI